MMNEADLFHVEAVEAASPPSDTVETGWCRYVVANERSRIVGRFRGTLVQTRRNAEDLVQGLNGRLRSGKAPGTAQSRGRSKHRVRAGSRADKVS